MYEVPDSISSMNNEGEGRQRGGGGGQNREKIRWRILPKTLEARYGGTLPITSALGRPRQEDQEFKVTISGYIDEFKDIQVYIYKQGKEVREGGKEKKYIPQNP